MLERCRTTTLGENIAMLIDIVHFYKFNIAWANLLVESMVLNSIVFRSVCHLVRFKLSKGESANISFLDLDVHVRVIVHWKIDSSAKFTDEIK